LISGLAVMSKILPLAVFSNTLRLALSMLTIWADAVVVSDTVALPGATVVEVVVAGACWASAAKVVAKAMDAPIIRAIVDPAVLTLDLHG
jgi:hypothetical protein